MSFPIRGMTKAANTGTLPRIASYSQGLGFRPMDRVRMQSATVLHGTGRMCPHPGSGRCDAKEQRVFLSLNVDCSCDHSGHCAIAVPSFLRSRMAANESARSGIDPDPEHGAVSYYSLICQLVLQVPWEPLSEAVVLRPNVGHACLIDSALAGGLGAVTHSRADHVPAHRTQRTILSRPRYCGLFESAISVRTKTRWCASNMAAITTAITPAHRNSSP